MTRRDGLAGAALLVVAWGEQLAGGREQLGLHLALAVLMTLPIAFAARRPWLPAAACSVALVVYGTIGSEPDATGEIFALGGAAFLSASRLSVRPAMAALLLMALAGTVHLALLGGLADVAFMVGIFMAPPFLLGRAVRGRRKRIAELRALNEQLVEERERTALLAAQVERARIRRDLEAVVAAGLDRMIVTARRGEALTGADAAAAFEAIRRDGAEATAELRRLLRLMHA